MDNKGVIGVKPELLMIKAFKDLWESDKPEKVRKYFAYIYFKHDFKSPYKHRYEEHEMEEKLLKDVIQQKTWKRSLLVKDAELKYQELQQTKSLKTLQSAENALLQINLYFNDFILEDIPERLRHTAVKNMMSNLKEIDDVIDKIEKARRRVEEELVSKALAGKRKLGKRELPPSQR